MRMPASRGRLEHGLVEREVAVALVVDVVELADGGDAGVAHLGEGAGARSGAASRGRASSTSAYIASRQVQKLAGARRGSVSPWPRRPRWKACEWASTKPGSSATRGSTLGVGVGPGAPPPRSGRRRRPRPGAGLEAARRSRSARLSSTLGSSPPCSSGAMSPSSSSPARRTPPPAATRWACAPPRCCRARTGRTRIRRAAASRRRWRT